MTLETSTRVMESYLLFKRNNQFFELSAETLARIKVGDKTNEVQTYFSLAAKACMLTKNPARGLALLNNMTDL